MIEKVNKWLPIATAVVVIVILGILVGGKSQPQEIVVKVEYPSEETQLGVGTRYPNGISVGTSTPTQFKLTVGNPGTAIQNIIFGTCDLRGPDAGLLASTTAMFECDATGAIAGDNVYATLPGGANVGTAAGSPAIDFEVSLGTFVLGAVFSTTTDKLGFEITNFGSATTSFAQATTGIQYLIFR